MISKIYVYECFEEAENGTSTVDEEKLEKPPEQRERAKSLSDLVLKTENLKLNENEDNKIKYKYSK